MWNLWGVEPSNMKLARLNKYRRTLCVERLEERCVLAPVSFSDVDASAADISYSESSLATDAGLLRIVAWNTANHPNDSTQDLQFSTILEAIGNEEVQGTAARIDVLALQETDAGSSVDVAEIMNAIYDAVGVRIKDLPVTPEKILEELEKKERRENP